MPAKKVAKSSKAAKPSNNRGLQPALAQHLKAWRQRRANETGQKFIQRDAAAELGIPYPTYIQYEIAARGQNMNTLLYRYIMEKIQAPKVKKKS